MARNDKDYALVIGIDTYPQLQRLRSAHTDATDFANWLKREDGGGLPEGNVTLLTGPDNPPLLDVDFKPTWPQVRQWMRQMGFAENEWIGRRLYIYFAGHGFGPEFDSVGMLMIDASEAELDQNIGLRKCRSYFRNHLLFDEVIYIVDCCRDSRGLSDDLLRGPGFTIAGQPNNSAEFVVLAAQYGDKAIAVDRDANGRRRGLLTEALLEGLERATDGVGRVTSTQLRDYIRKRVPELAASSPGLDVKLKKAQAEILTAPDPPLVFTTIASDQLPRVEVHVKVQSEKPGTLELFDGAGTRLDQIPAKDAVTEPWKLSLERNRLVFVVKNSGTGEQQPIMPQTVTVEPLILTFK